MIRIKPHVRSTGVGPAVLLLHSSGSSARQWDPLVARLSGGGYRMHAIDLHGHGGTPAWQGEGRMRLEDDAALVEPLLHHPDGVHLVGHSYGGALALKLATLHPERVRSVAVYEPVLFRLLFDYQARSRAATEVTIAAASIRGWLARGDAERAAQRFVDFWSGTGSWDELPARQRQTIAQRMPAVVGHFHALFHDTLTREALSRLSMPILCLSGSATRAATRRLAELLRLALPAARHESLVGLGHMGPVTHPDAFGARIAAFLALHARHKAVPEPLLEAA